MKLKKGLLCQILGQRNITNGSIANGKDLCPVPSVKLFKCLMITFLRQRYYLSLAESGVGVGGPEIRR
jgi:hypothetical protein